MTSNKRGFTLIELMVVIAMIAIFMTAVGTSVGQTRERARMEKARRDVKVLSQAILAWENYDRGGKNELDEMNDEEADSSSLKFLLGQGEAAKSGFAPSELPAALEKAGQYSGIRVRGLMTIPPICRSPEENLPYCRLLRQLFIDNGEKKYDNVRMDFMSMGMSGDYEAAIACGANIVRVGTAIFGQRHYGVT